MADTGEVQFRAMTEADIDAVLAIELQIHNHPWTRGMFIDSLTGGHEGWLMIRGKELIAYAILMPVLDEIHLLDIGVAKNWQRQGFGEKIYNLIIMLYKDRGMQKLLLEVRQSNAAALALYRHAGCREIGRRKGYYPTTDGREDAIVMESKLQ